VERLHDRKPPCPKPLLAPNPQHQTPKPRPIHYHVQGAPCAPQVFTTLSQAEQDGQQGEEEEEDMDSISRAANRATPGATGGWAGVGGMGGGRAGGGGGLSPRQPDDAEGNADEVEDEDGNNDGNRWVRARHLRPCVCGTIDANASEWVTDTDTSYQWVTDTSYQWVTDTSYQWVTDTSYSYQWVLEHRAERRRDNVQASLQGTLLDNVQDTRPLAHTNTHTHTHTHVHANTQG
jgi:hypothetical protein